MQLLQGVKCRVGRHQSEVCKIGPLPRPRVGSLLGLGFLLLLAIRKVYITKFNMYHYIKNNLDSIKVNRSFLTSQMKKINRDFFVPMVINNLGG